MDSKNDVILHKPKFQELSFREEYMQDKDTMSYNNKYGGAVGFPKNKWEEWFKRWMLDESGKHFYRYLLDVKNHQFVGDVAYYLDQSQNIYICSVVVLAKFRGKGYGTQGLKLLFQSAKDNGIKYLYDNIDIDNKSSIRLFKQNGFIEVGNDGKCVMLRKEI